MTDTSSSNKRIAKNTLLLYVRTIFIMFISLYTSRVVLNALGVENYGIYNVVGGVVAMFSLISGSLSSSISRFITFELGKGNIEKLKVIFSTSINIQVAISVIVLFLGETIGVWFLKTHMNIPDGRLDAAIWVLHCSLIMFCVNLINIPYNACIIAHERMTAFAYVSILEASLRLLICYLIVVSPFDRLISYAVMLVIVSFVIRLVYGIYCSRHFEECKYQMIYDRKQLREMTGFAGWTFMTSCSYLFNTQGVNILINIFFGVTLNAARGVATQVDAAIMQFVNNFTMAINPQITKQYACGKTEEMFLLVCRGAKFSYFLLLIFSLPVLFETEYILTMWLKIVPDHAVMFLRLTIIGSMINMLGNTGYTACMATGTVRRYVIWISSVGCLVFPLTWICFTLGMAPESTYVVFILVYVSVDTVRLYIMKGLLKFPPIMFIKEVVVRILLVSTVAVIIPAIIIYSMPPSFIRLVISVLVCVLMASTTIYTLGLTSRERIVVSNKIVQMKNKMIKR